MATGAKQRFVVKLLDDRAKFAQLRVRGAVERKVGEIVERSLGPPLERLRQHGRGALGFVVVKKRPTSYELRLRERVVELFGRDVEAITGCRGHEAWRRRAHRTA